MKSLLDHGLEPVVVLQILETLAFGESDVRGLYGKDILHVHLLTYLDLLRP